MARFFGDILTKPYIGQPYSQPIATCTPIEGKPRTVKISINWSLYGATPLTKGMGVNVNLLGQAVQTPLDKIRSVYIDNTNSPSIISVTFPDTQFTVLCPAGAIVLCPVFTNVQEALVYCDEFVTGQIPLTTVHFANVHCEGIYIPPVEGEGFVANPIELIFRGYAEKISPPSGSMTYNGVDIGEAKPERLVIVTAQASAQNSISSASITCNGSEMTKAIQHNGYYGTGSGGSQLYQAIAYANVTAGETANIVFTPSFHTNHMSLSVYTLTGNTETVHQTVKTAASQSIIMPEESVGIFTAKDWFLLDEVTDQQVWTNVSKDFEYGLGSSASLRQTDQSSIIVECTRASFILGASFV